MDTYSVQKCTDYVAKYKLSYVQIIWGRRLMLLECLPSKSCPLQLFTSVQWVTILHKPHVVFGNTVTKRNKHYIAVQWFIHLYLLRDLRGDISSISNRLLYTGITLTCQSNVSLCLFDLMPVCSGPCHTIHSLDQHRTDGYPEKSRRATHD